MDNQKFDALQLVIDSRVDLVNAKLKFSEKIPSIIKGINSQELTAGVKILANTLDNIDEAINTLEPLERSLQGKIIIR